MSDNSVFDQVVDDVIEFVNGGAHGVTDFVTKTAARYGVQKGEVRAIVNHYDKNPGAPQGRPKAGRVFTPEVAPELPPEATPGYLREPSGAAA